MKRITLSVLALSLISTAAFAQTATEAKPAEPVKVEAPKAGDTKAVVKDAVKGDHKDAKKDEKKVEPAKTETK